MNKKFLLNIAMAALIPLSLNAEKSQSWGAYFAQKRAAISMNVKAAVVSVAQKWGLTAAQYPSKHTPEQIEQSLKSTKSMLQIVQNGHALFCSGQTDFSGHTLVAIQEELAQSSSGKNLAEKIKNYLDEIQSYHVLLHKARPEIYTKFYKKLQSEGAFCPQEIQDTYSEVLNYLQKQKENCEKELLKLKAALQAYEEQTKVCKKRVETIKYASKIAGLYCAVGIASYAAAPYIWPIIDAVPHKGRMLTSLGVFGAFAAGIYAIDEQEHADSLDEA